MIICVGSVFLDHIIQIDKFPKKPIKILANNIEKRLGGSAAVAACTISKLGSKTRLLTKFGNDEAKKFLVKELKKFKVNLKSSLTIKNTNSSQSFVFEDKRGERLLGAYNEKKLLNYKLLPKIEFKSKYVFLADLRWIKATSYLAKHCVKNNLDLIVDLDNFKTNNNIDYIVEKASYPIFSETGLQEYSKIDNALEGMKKLILKNKKFYAVTLGDKGVYWYENNSIMHCKAPKIKTKETNCAGDVFHGAFANFVFKNNSISESMKLATATASLKCMKKGGVYSIPTLSEVKRFAKKLDIKKVASINV